MKATVIVICVLAVLLFIAVSVCVQIFRAYRNTNKKLNEANSEIAALKQRVELEKAKQEVMNDEQSKADKDKENLHTGSDTDKFNAAYDILHNNKN